jgi:lipopolysaccharide transport system ATP-binding protein
MVLAVFDKIPLLKGSYLLSVHLMCERGLHLYDFVNGVATLHVQQEGRTQGFFAIPHRWDASC